MFLLQAVEVLKAQRIGHGYNTPKDPALYQQLLKQNMHFEVTVDGSLLTVAEIIFEIHTHIFVHQLSDKICINMHDFIMCHIDLYIALQSWSKCSYTIMAQ